MSDEYSMQRIDLPPEGEASIAVVIQHRCLPKGACAKFWVRVSDEQGVLLPNQLEGIGELANDFLRAEVQPRVKDAI